MTGHHKTPQAPGFYWGRWIKACPGTKEGDDLAPAHEWEVMHVVDNNSDVPMVMVPGVQKWQPLENFEWGEFVSPERPIETPSPTAGLEIE